MLYIDGTWGPAASGRTFQATNPANGDVLGEVADADGADTAAAIDAARRAFPARS